MDETELACATPIREPAHSTLTTLREQLRGLLIAELTCPLFSMGLSTSVLALANQIVPNCCSDLLNLSRALSCATTKRRP